MLNRESASLLVIIAVAMWMRSPLACGSAPRRQWFGVTAARRAAAP
jgi:hypothetical protein